MENVRTMRDSPAEWQRRSWHDHLEICFSGAIGKYLIGPSGQYRFDSVIAQPLHQQQGLALATPPAFRQINMEYAHRRMIPKMKAPPERSGGANLAVSQDASV